MCRRWPVRCRKPLFLAVKRNGNHWLGLLKRSPITLTRTHTHTLTHARTFFKDAKLAYGTRLGAYEDATRLQNREAEAARQMAQTVRSPRLHGWIHTCSSSSSSSSSSGVLCDGGFEFALLQCGFSVASVCVVLLCWCVNRVPNGANIDDLAFTSVVVSEVCTIYVMY